jgi:hypothetical protein
MPGRESCTTFAASENDRRCSSADRRFVQIGVRDPDMEICEHTNMAEICESCRCLFRVRMTQNHVFLHNPKIHCSQIIL